ncbi:uncharacterized protein LOC126564106 [Anopheles maculipalpis]|uniref:uncharacterized protein LOC126564106 n=1 Tax=Anopheles maculipalpis TaxID=1496333 RepID=UPI002158C0FC|nr:uncharacterized protein LOC126564106 [Anopheles maculipalpis]
MQFIRQSVVVLILLCNRYSNGDTTSMAQLANERQINAIELAMMPNIRESLDDCHMRYYKYDLPKEEYSVYDRPRLKFRELPHLAMIGWTGLDGTVGWNCMGALVWENFILTSASCTQNENRIAPDVMRMGNPGEEQQIKIGEVIRHPEYRESDRQHNIALLRLESKVQLDGTAVPVCLWTEEENHFRSMEAVRRNDLGTSIPTKVTVRPVPGSCDAGSSNATVQRSELCVDSGETDSCMWIAGGFLQVSLLHSAKVSPYLIAISSSSSGSCARSKSTEYTKVFSYFEWIQSTIEAAGTSAWAWKLRETGCALRYINLRPYEKDVIIGETASHYTVSSARRYIDPRDTHAMAEIHFTGFNSNVDDCNGLIIDEDTVLTLAQCTTKHGKRATYVKYMYNEENTVVKHYNHPGYRDGQLYNDIGLLKVKMRFTFFEYFVPQCLWHGEEIPQEKIELTGKGREDLNTLFIHDEPVEVFYPQTIRLTPRVEVLPFDNCSYPEEISKNLPRGLTEEHLCFGNEPYLVPTTCTQTFGGPIGGLAYRFNRTFRYAFALNLAGRDCGFGWAALGVRLASHIDWLKSMLLPGHKADSGSVHFLHSDLEENDTCRHVDGTIGVCVDAGRCPRIRYEFSVNRQVVFCSSSSVVCCPYENLLNETSVAGRELDECEDRYKEERKLSTERLFGNGPLSDDFPHLVEIGWQASGDTNVQWNCRGTIIASSAILTSAKCVKQQTNSPSLVRLGVNNAAPVMDVQETIMHPEYDRATGKNDIAVVKLRHSIEKRSTTKYPACIWSNQTHTPFEMIQLIINESGEDYVFSTAKYNTDCGDSETEIASRQLCVDVHPPNTVVTEGDPMFWTKTLADGTMAQYLVGIMSHTAANDGSVKIHHRMSSYVGWIKSIL